MTKKDRIKKIEKKMVNFISKENLWDEKEEVLIDIVKEKFKKDFKKIKDAEHENEVIL